jgi:TAT (twin-arginine translocation) pathway signal sequence
VFNRRIELFLEGGIRLRGFDEPSRVLTRRDFLRLGGVGAAALVLGVMGSGELFAQEDPSSYSSLVEEFDEAAREYEIPVALLFAMGYVNTRWEMPPPDASAYRPGDPHGRGAYGIMQLVQNKDEDTLGDASKLTGISEEQLKTDRRSNILGGAALLADAQGDRPIRLRDYFGAVSGKGGRRLFKAVAGIGAGELYAEQVFDVLRRGTYETILDGEPVDLPSQEGAL